MEPCIDELEVYSTGETSANIAFAIVGAKATSSGDYPSNVRHKLSHINDGRYGNERSWISNQSGRGWVQIELAKPTKIDRVVWGRDHNPDGIQRRLTDVEGRVVTEILA